MPRSARSFADYVMTPEQIANKLGRLAKARNGARLPLVESAPPTNDDSLRQIFGLIRSTGGVDFGHYKRGTVRRRIAHHMAIKKIGNLQAYLELLRQNEEEVSALYQDLLITVTEFFRDARAFNFLKDAVIPKILEGLPNDTPARVWVPGCASGEEAYSIAICFAEAAHGRGNVPVRIFATDVSNACIAAARRAVYPANITANVSRERLRRFFVKQDGGYR